MPLTITHAGPGTFTIVDTTGLEVALALENVLGPTALLQTGSLANLLASLGSVTADISDTLIVIKNQQGQMLTALQGLQGTIQQQTMTMNRMATMQAMAVSDQIKTNAHDRAETVAALKRNGIDPQPEPDVKERMKEVLKDSTTMHALAEFSTWTNNFVDGILSGLINFIKTSAPYIYATDAINAVGSKIKGLFSSLGEFISTNAKDIAKQARAVAARTGVWTPSA